MIKEAVIIGYSGHSFVVLDSIIGNEYSVIGYLETKHKLFNPYGLTYLGSEEDIELVNSLIDKHFFLGIGSNIIREKILTSLIKMGAFLPFLIDRSARISAMASIGNGTIVLAGAVVNSMSTIGDGVICNTSSIIEHECNVGNFCHIAPGAVLAGNVTIGDGSFVGANAVVRQGIKIGKNVTIGAGAVVVKDVADGLVVYGNPAQT